MHKSNFLHLELISKVWSCAILVLYNSAYDTLMQPPIFLKRWGMKGRAGHHHNHRHVVCYIR